MKFSTNKRAVSYLGIFLVVIIWGIYPITIRLLYDHYSAAALKVFSGLVATVSLLIICRKKLRFLNRDYFKVAIPCGLFYSLGEVTQTIGFQYTTPTTGSFLENLSCIAVPLLMFVFIRKKPTLINLISILLCLSSVFLLSITQTEGANRPIGIILCSLAGIFYGVNIAGTGVYAKKLDSRLYVFIQMGVLTIISAISAIVLQFIPTQDGGAFEEIKFSFNPPILVLAAIHAIVISVVCWVIRTSSMKYVDASAVAVIMPFSAVVTGIISLMLGKDSLSLTFILGALCGLGAVFLSSVGDSIEEKRHVKTKQKIYSEEK